MTEDERLQWESEKYSTRTASIFMLDSGRFVVASHDLKVVRVGTWAEAKEYVCEISATPFPVYISPKERESLTDLPLEI